MPKKVSEKLLLQHLENVSWKTLHDYPVIISRLMKGKPGIYALYRRDKLYYVGLASGLRGRLRAHLRDRHSGKWDRFSVYLTCHDSHMKELESLLIRIVAPDGNRQGGKFAGSTDLRRVLKAAIKETDDDRRSDYLGEKRKPRAAKSSGNKGRLKLGGMFSREITLKGWRYGYEYTALLKRDGRIQYGRKVFDSPTAASRDAANHLSGGHFWHYRSKSGEWLPIGTLRQAR